MTAHANLRTALAQSLSSAASGTNSLRHFAGGVLWLEYAGSSQRMKSTMVKNLMLDEIDEAPQSTAVAK